MSSAPGAIQPFGALQHLGPDVLVAMGLPELGQARHELGRPGPRSLQAEGAQPVAQLRVGIPAQPLGCLHEVTVGVEDPGFHVAPRSHRRLQRRPAPADKGAVSCIENTELPQGVLRVCNHSPLAS